MIKNIICKTGNIANISKDNNYIDDLHCQDDCNILNTQNNYKFGYTDVSRGTQLIRYLSNERLKFDDEEQLIDSVKDIDNSLAELGINFNEIEVLEALPSGELIIRINTDDSRNMNLYPFQSFKINSGDFDCNCTMIDGCLITQGKTCCRITSDDKLLPKYLGKGKLTIKH